MINALVAIGGIAIFILIGAGVILFMLWLIVEIAYKNKKDGGEE